MPPHHLYAKYAAPEVVIRFPAAVPTGRTLLLQLPPEIRRTGPCGLLARLTGRRWNRTAGEAEAELRRRVNEHAARLLLPLAVPVAGSAEKAEPVDDLLTVYTVLAKSSDRVYLRDKEPNVSRIKPGRAVVLRLPASTEEKP
jgi:hypothetical protein